MVRLECERLTKKFDAGGRSITAVDSVDFSIEDGTFVTILGPSGCGKTTLLRMIAGLETPSNGTITFDDEDVTDTSVQDRRISMVFQSIALFPYKSVRKNIEYGLKYAGASKGERREEAEEMAKMLDIEDLLGNKPNQLSGGQRQRVALARALIREPNVFLLDEPMSDLDAQLKIDLRTELKELHKEFQTTTLYVTHDQEEAMTLSEEIIVMDGGEIQQKSPPFELFTNPNNMFVARFIGSPNINFFDAEFDGAQLSVAGFDRSISLDSETVSTIEQELEGDEVCLGIRPSALSVVEDPKETSFEVSTEIYEQLGDETILHSHLVGVEEQDVRALIPPKMVPEEGEMVRLTFDRSDVHIFDPATGEAITNGLDDQTKIAAPDEESAP